MSSIVQVLPNWNKQSRDDLPCGAPRKRRVKRGQSPIDAQHSRIYIFSLPRPTILSPDTFHFFSPPTIPNSSSRALPRTAGETVKPSSSCSSSRPRELRSMQPVARPSVRTGYGGGHCGVLPNATHERETSMRWKTAEGDFD